jgi:predicted transcriptional regulator
MAMNRLGSHGSMFSSRPKDQNNLSLHWRLLMAKKLLEIAAEIVQAQVSTNQLATEEIVSSLKHVFSALRDMQKSETEGMPLELAKASEEPVPEEAVPGKIDPKGSIQEDKVICLECGAEMRQLTAKHLSSHSLSIRDYKHKYGFPLRQSLSAKALSKARSKAAKKRGLPEKLLKFQEERKRKKELALQEAMRVPAETAPEKGPKPVTRRRKKES